MGISLSTIQQKAAEEFPSYEIDLEDGRALRLVSPADMNDEQLDWFSNAQKELMSHDDENDLRAMKGDFIEALSVVSDNADLAREVLSTQTLGVLLLIFRDYTGSVSDSMSKSDQPEEAAQ